jgi:hypothetical protein
MILGFVELGIGFDISVLASYWLKHSIINPVIVNKVINNLPWSYWFLIKSVKNLPIW